MPNQRSANQTLIAFALHRELLRAMDSACDHSGEDRSTFIRTALVAKIEACEQPVQADWVKAQVRAPGLHRYVSPDSLPKPAVPRAPAGRKRSSAVVVKKGKAAAGRGSKR